MNLGKIARGRDNNFNALRATAALSVLFTHSFAIVTGLPSAEPLRQQLGMTLGTIAVDIFFFTSGFLVTASLFARRRTLQFIVARALRIFPALLVMLLLSVFPLGLYFSTVSSAAYLAHPQTWHYFIKCVTLIGDVEYWLPGVFAGNPLASVVNGSLWSMTPEVRMYAILACVWALLRIAGNRRADAMKLLVIVGAAILAILVAAEHLGMIADRGYFLRLYFLFFAGSSCFILRDHIVLSRFAFAACLAAVVASAVDRDLFFFVYSALIGYLVLCAAYMPGGWIRNFNRVGDYSYGIYIYAFPVQQSIVAVWPGIPVYGMIILSGVVTLTLACLSWHLVEHRALHLKRRSSSHPTAQNQAAIADGAVP